MLSLFLKQARDVRSLVSVISVSWRGFLCTCFFNAHCDVYLEFQMLFPPSFFFSPLTLLLWLLLLIVHCVWGWTWAHPWSRNRRKHLSGIICSLFSPLFYCLGCVETPKTGGSVLPPKTKVAWLMQIYLGAGALLLAIGHKSSCW